jgi:hypothetical protein
MNLGAYPPKAKSHARGFGVAVQAQRLCLWGETGSQCGALRHRADNGDLIRVYQGLYVRPSYWHTLDKRERYRHIIRSLAVLHPQWVFCEMTAAALHGINTATRHMKLVNIAVCRRNRVRDYGLVRHHDIPNIQIEIVDGVRITPLSRTIFDCIRQQEFPDALAIADAALRDQGMSKDSLKQQMLSQCGWRKDKVLKVLEFATGETENGGESFSLGVMLDGGLAVPTLQEKIINPLNLSQCDRVDFAWHTADGRFIVAELDGRVKYRDPTMYKNGSLPDTIIAEKEREERIRLVVDEVVRFSFREALERGPLLYKLNRAGVPRR